MNIDIGHITELTPPVILMLALNVVGSALKQTKLPARLIPLVLPVLGGIAFPWIYDVSDMIINVRSQTAVAVVMGVIIGGAAVGANQALTAIWPKKK